MPRSRPKPRLLASRLCGSPLTLITLLLLPAAGCRDWPDRDDSLPDATRDGGPGADASDGGPFPVDGGQALIDDVDFLDRPDATHLRFATYNIWRNSIFEDQAAQARFARVVRAVDADIWALQEIWEPVQSVASLFDRLLPLPDGARWKAVYAGARVTVSRFPIRLHHWETDPSCGSKVSLDLIDLPDGDFYADLYVVHPHFTPFEGAAQDAARQCEADQVISWLRRASDPAGPVGLPPGTPVIIAGDLNMVGSLGPLHTLLSGDIADEARFGPDYPPDWDGSAATDASPLHNGVGPETWTWRSDSSGWAPGRLDFIIYTDSVLHALGSFVLNTTRFSEAALDEAGLERLDVAREELSDGGIAFDHIPVVADFAVPPW